MVDFWSVSGWRSAGVWPAFTPARVEVERLPLDVSVDQVVVDAGLPGWMLAVPHTHVVTGRR